MRKTGPAKVYTLSARLPAEQIISQSSDLILVLDDTYTVRNVSDSFLTAFGIRADQIENLDINTTSLGPGLIDRLRDPVRQGIAGEAAAVNAWIPVQKEWRVFRIRITPLVFSWGARGVVIVLEDRTGEIMAQEENTFLADLVDASPAAITVSDFEGNLLYSNKKNLELHGYSQSEILAMNLRDLDNPESAELMDNRLEELKRTGESSFEVVHRKKDGQEMPLEVHSKITRWGDRDVVIAIATDVSERKRAERALRESERRFSDIINFLPDATYVINGEGTVIAWNRAIENLTGTRAREILGKGDHAYALAIHGERRPILIDLVFHDDPVVRKRYRHLRKKGDTFTAEMILETADAGERTLWLKASPFYDRDGRIAGAIEAIRDITDRKLAEEELRKSEHKFATVFKSNPVSLTLVTAADGVFVDVNDTFLINTGYDREEVIGKTAENLGIFADNEQHAQMVSQLRDKGHTEGLELRCRIKSGEIRTCLFSSGIILMGESPHILSTVEDITERKNAEEVRHLQTRALASLNTLAIDLASMSSAKPVEKIILKTLMKMSGAVASWFSVYDPDDRTLRVTDLEIVPGMLKKVVHLLGNRPFDMRIPVSDAMYQEITHHIIGKKKTLTEVSFGQIPPIVSTGIQTLVGIDRLIGIACVIEGQLYGISMVAMKAGQPDPPTEILESFSHVVAVSLRRRRVETALMESESRFRALFENANDAISVHGFAADGLPSRFTDVNEKACRISGYSREELLSLSPRELYISEESAELPGSARKISDRENCISLKSLVRKDGKKIPVEISSHNFILDNENVQISLFRDITERRNAEDALRESRERYRLILKNANDGIMVNELTPAGPGKFIDVNDQACRILGMNRKELQTISLIDLDTPEMKTRAPEIFREIMKNNHLVFQTNYRTKDRQEKIIDISVSLFDLNKRPTMLSIIRDITDRKALEQTSGD